jgi:uncharacterized protein YciI
MNALAADGFVLFAGPLSGSDHERLRALVIVNANSTDEIHQRLAGDPWVHANRLRTTSIEPWTLLVGAERIPRP